ncbi:hypothetical protein ElyMa_006211400 [Elysia marginata]|uniref:Uncharacterized protein n=1 Tax=Elysia marginata TaxID=1093978 RepID=A0AAV4H5P6_9GAST|nr:hypothetical protein ElyMa_006211400 [Elysia marginata]
MKQIPIETEIQQTEMGLDRLHSIKSHFQRHVKQALDSNLHGKRNAGRPKQTYRTNTNYGLAESRQRRMSPFQEDQSKTCVLERREKSCRRLLYPTKYKGLSHVKTTTLPK